MLLTASHRLLSEINLLRYVASKSLVSEVSYNKYFSKYKIYLHYVWRSRMQNHINYERIRKIFSIFSHFTRAHSCFIKDEKKQAPHCIWILKFGKSDWHKQREREREREAEKEREDAICTKINGRKTEIIAANCGACGNLCKKFRKSLRRMNTFSHVSSNRIMRM